MVRARIASLFLTLAIPVAVLADGLLGPSPYLSFEDSPFYDTTFDIFEIEDFEDGTLDLANTTVNSGFVLNPGEKTDSVDADDGAFDGFGTAGHSYYAGDTECLIFKFSSESGQLPTHVGLVWTDVGTVPGGVFGIAQVTFEAFDQQGDSLGVITADELGDGRVDGTTADDRFFGVVNFAGVSEIQICTIGSNDWEIDHVQIGILPEPATALVLLIGAIALRRRA